jgi:hypothetical protein
LSSDFVDVFASIPGEHYQRQRDGWSFDWTDQKVFIRLVFNALVTMLSQLPENAIVSMPEWTKCIHCLKAT